MNGGSFPKVSDPKKDKNFQCFKHSLALIDDRVGKRVAGEHADDG